MKIKALLSTTALSAICSAPAFISALAAPPAPVPVFSWTGFYIGGHVGKGWTDSSVTENGLTPPAFGGLVFTPGVVTDMNSSGVMYGFQGGYNWQFANNFVVGIEGDLSFSSIGRDFTPFGAFATYSSEFNRLGTIRGRIGYAFDRLMIYGTGGWATARLKNQLDATALFPVTGLTARDSSPSGYAVGGGMEYALLGNWTVKAEYIHAGFSDRTGQIPLAPGANYTFTFKDSIDVVRAGLNYKF